VQVVKKGAVCRYSEKAAAGAVSAKDVRIELDLNAGKHSAIAWTCDLTAGYIKINADYHT